MSDVFISYARSSAKEPAVALKDALVAHGVKVFLDELEIPAGGVFPAYLADALIATKLVIVFADETYFSKTWCIYEFNVCIAPCMQAGTQSLNDAACQHIIITLPEKGDVGKVVDHLPVALKSGSWLVHNKTAALAEQVMQQLAVVQETLGEKLKELDNDAVKSLRNGALINAASKLPQKLKYIDYLPASLKENFVGRAGKLWQIFAALETKAGQELGRSVLIEGGAGMGKSQLAAEYVWRYGPAHYPGGIVWINADCTNDELQRQYAGVAKAFQIDVPVSDINVTENNSVNFYAELLVTYFSNLPGNEAVLWIADNIPEPKANVPVMPVSYWCPVIASVSFICTSRQANIKNIDTYILLSELSVPAAIELLTQPPVNKAWATDAEWEKMARAVGCWPMGLRIMQASIADSIISPAALIEKIDGKNPSPLLDDTVKELKGYVEEGYVKAVSELLQVSYNDLKNFPVALSGAHAIAWLARMPVQESLLLQLLPGNWVAILGKRHWIDAAEKQGESSERLWQMHRIMAGFFRSMNARPEQAFNTLINWFANLTASGVAWKPSWNLDTHFRVFSNSLIDWLVKNKSAALLSAARELALNMAVFRLEDADARGLRFSAVTIAIQLGMEAAVLEKYETAYLQGDEETAKGIAYGLRAMSSAEAANLQVELFSSKSETVRWQALSSISANANTAIVAMPWMEALLKEKGEFFLESCAANFDNIFAAVDDKTKITLLNRIMQAVSEEGQEQLFPLLLLGRLLLRYGKSFNAGGFTYDAISKILFNKVVEATDEVIAENAAATLAYAYESGATFQQLLNVLTSETEPGKMMRLFSAALAYVACLARPKPLKDVRATFNDEGGLQINMHLGADGMNVVPFYRALVFRVASLQSNKERDTIVEKIGRSEAGLKAIQEEINLLIDEANWPLVMNLAQAVLNRLPVFKVNGHWWRAQAYSKLNMTNEAISDLSAVISLAPAFNDARVKRMMLYRAAGNLTAAANDLDYLQKTSEGDYYKLYDLGYSFFNLKEYSEALTCFTQSIDLNNQHAPSWYLRSYTNFYLVNRDAAMNDISTAIKLAPTDESFAQFRNYLLNN